jgi:hypothetical protein
MALFSGSTSTPYLYVDGRLYSYTDPDGMQAIKKTKKAPKEASSEAKERKAMEAHWKKLRAHVDPNSQARQTGVLPSWDTSSKINLKSNNAKRLLKRVRKLIKGYKYKKHKIELALRVVSLMAIGLKTHHCAATAIHAVATVNWLIGNRKVSHTNWAKGVWGKKTNYRRVPSFYPNKPWRPAPGRPLNTITVKKYFFNKRVKNIYKLYGTSMKDNELAAGNIWTNTLPAFGQTGGVATGHTSLVVLRTKNYYITLDGHSTRAAGMELHWFSGQVPVGDVTTVFGKMTPSVGALPTGGKHFRPRY